MKRFKTHTKNVENVLVLVRLDDSNLIYLKVVVEILNEVFLNIRIKKDPMTMKNDSKKLNGFSNILMKKVVN